MPYGFKLSHRLSLTKAAIVSAGVLVACTTDHSPTALTPPTSSVVSAAGTPSGVPGSVSDLAIASTSDTSVTLSLTEVDDGTGQPASYDVRSVPGSTISWGGTAPSVKRGTCATPVAGVKVGAQRTCTVLGLAANSAYAFQLVAYRGTLNLNAVFGPLSNTTSGTTASAPSGSGVPGSVADLAIAGTTDSSVTLSFTDVNDGTGRAASYDVRFVPGSSLTWGSAAPSVTRGSCATPLAGKSVGAKRTCTVLGLTPSTIYSFELVAYRGTLNLNAVFGALSNVATGVTAASTPVPVASVSVSPATASVAAGSTLQLTATPRDANGNAVSGRAVSWQTSNSAVATVSATGLVKGVAVGSATITATSEGKNGTAVITVTAPPPPGGSQFGHVFVVTEENTDYADVTSSSMPYLTSLAAQYGLATQYYANTHPSIGNYFEMATGQVLTNDDGSSTIQNVPNIVRSLVAAGKTWKSYAENLPNACYLGGDTGNYARKHNVFALLSDVANDPTGQACNIVPFTQFKTDLANGTLPAFSNIVPNLCDDAHDCSLGNADSWLRTNIAPLLASPVFQKDGLLIITFDESGGDNSLGGGRVYWVAISPKSKRGYQSTTTYQHPSTLRLILQGLGAKVFPGAAASAPDMSEFFTP